jgi:SPOR domain
LQQNWDKSGKVIENNNSWEYLSILSGNYYFCAMIRKLFFFSIILLISTRITIAQAFIKTEDLFNKTESNNHSGKMIIVQDPAIDTLISRYILANENIYKETGRYGMEGFRIQIYSSSNRNAREESNKARAAFMSKFPDIVSYPLYAEPGYFKIRVGDFRTKTEATKLFQLVSKEFPDAYLVPDIINFPDLNTK